MRSITAESLGYTEADVISARWAHASRLAVDARAVAARRRAEGDDLAARRADAVAARHQAEADRWAGRMMRI